jgi:ketosteroid isomerase-like protein
MTDEQIGLVEQAQKRFDAAELAGDAEALDGLLTPDFLSIGPKGFVLTKSEWIGRHIHFTYHALDVNEVDIRLYGDAAIVRNVQRNRATYDGNETAIAVRVSQTWVRQGDAWQLAGIQFSPLAEG